jgi:hydrogenase maturation protein HypF
MIAVQHHHAHASAVAGEFGVGQPMLCFTWDGMGYGQDGTLWGGEAFWGAPGRWRRVASWRPFKLPGALRAATQPWRSALGLLWQSGRNGAAMHVEADSLLRNAFDGGVGTLETSAVGRLFDAAAAFLGLGGAITYDAQAPLRLERLAAEATVRPEPLAVPLASDSEGVLRSDWEPLVAMLTDGRRAADQRAWMFHVSLARALAEQAMALSSRFVFRDIGLSGGVFHNRLLCDAVQTGLRERGFRVLIPERLPMNDACISFGQAVECAALQAR